jgi:ABC-2 type transport system permease protein
MTGPPLRVQVGRLARRSIARTLRQPVLIVPNLVFPLFMLLVLSANGDQVTKVKGFPTHSYITFLLAATLVQGAASATTLAGNLLGSDIESGFLSRIGLTPVRGSALVAAQLAGVAVLGIGQSVLYLLVGLAAGVTVKAGIGGALVLIAVSLLFILAFGSIGLFAALRTGSAQQVQSLFAVALGLLFMSSMVMPRNLIQVDWFKTIATYNPMSYLIEAPRSLLVSGWDGEALALGCGIAAATLIVMMTVATTSLRSRMLGS